MRVRRDPVPLFGAVPHRADRCLVGLAVVFIAAALFPLGATTAAAQPAQITQARFLTLAKEGIAAARKHWWNGHLGWYNDRLDRSWRPTMPLAYLWSAFPLFEAIDAVAIAQPTVANRATVDSFAHDAERYWNPYVKPLGGYAYYISTRSRAITYFDDNGWWGLAFVDAYRATGEHRYLVDASRAYAFIVNSGWDSGGGGTWWDTSHDHTTSEPLAAAAYIGAVLYSRTHRRSYLSEVEKLLDWARTHLWIPSAQLYGRNPADQTTMDYVQGMLIGAQLQLCTAASITDDCTAAVQLAHASMQQFSGPLSWSATADGIYLRFLLDLYRHTGNADLYQAAYTNAASALALAREPTTGLYLRSWNGATVSPPGLLRTHAGTVALFAWLAATRAP